MENGYQNSNSYLKSKEGILITEPKEIMIEWKRYFNELLNGEDKGKAEENWPIGKNEIFVGRPTKDEVKNIIKKMKKLEN